MKGGGERETKRYPYELPVRCREVGAIYCWERTEKGSTLTPSDKVLGGLMRKVEIVDSHPCSLLITGMS